MWGMYRKLRLTASNFGRVLGAIERKDKTGRAYPPSLFRALRGEYNLEKKDPIIWGQMHENEACEEYKQKTGNTVEETGFHLFPCGFLGCSPDGIIFPKEASEIYGALEIKCPWKHKDDTIQEMITKECATDSQKKKFFLTKDLELNPAHDYWHQVQAEMTVLGTTWAHFVVWTTKDIAIVKVLKDQSWEFNNIPKLSNFYLNELLPSCYTKEDWNINNPPWGIHCCQLKLALLPIFSNSLLANIFPQTLNLLLFMTPVHKTTVYNYCLYN